MMAEVHMKDEFNSDLNELILETGSGNLGTLCKNLLMRELANRRLNRDVEAYRIRRSIEIAKELGLGARGDASVRS